MKRNIRFTNVTGFVSLLFGLIFSCIILSGCYYSENKVYLLIVLTHGQNVENVEDRLEDLGYGAKAVGDNFVAFACTKLIDISAEVEKIKAIGMNYYTKSIDVSSEVKELVEAFEEDFSKNKMRILVKEKMLDLQDKIKNDNFNKKTFYEGAYKVLQEFEEDYPFSSLSRLKVDILVGLGDCILQNFG